MTSAMLSCSFGASILLISELYRTLGALGIWRDVASVS